MIGKTTVEGGALRVQRRRPGRASHNEDALALITPSQHRILAMLSIGAWSRREIAASLGCSEQTVKNQIADAYRRLDVDNLLAALRRTGCILTTE